MVGGRDVHLWLEEGEVMKSETFSDLDGRFMDAESMDAQGR